jgi:hypothetical protein
VKRRRRRSRAFVAVGRIRPAFEDHRDGRDGGEAPRLDGVAPLPLVLGALGQLDIAIDVVGCAAAGFDVLGSPGRELVIDRVRRPAPRAVCPVLLR